jgi:hypothetical protein
MSSIRTDVLFSTIVFIALSCSTSEKINDKSSVDVVQTTVDAWFDLMPGTSPGKFHLSGEVKLGNSSSADIENIKLKTITVYSKAEVIYNFKPYFSHMLKEDDFSLKIGSSKEFMFGTESVMSIYPRLEESNLIDVKLNFTLGEDDFIYEIKDVEIQRVY